jgi:hypothetical protein
VDVVQIHAERVEQVWVKINEVGKVVHQIVYQAHVEVSINAGKLDPFADEDMVIRKVGPNEQGNAEEQRQE